MPLAPHAGMKILVVYGSAHGYTAVIAGRIAARLRQLGASVSVARAPTSVRADEFDAVVVGARVHGSRYPLGITRFVRKNRRALGSRPSAFFSVSLLQLGRDPEKRAETEGLPARRMPRLGWTPDRTAVFGGALFWKAQYGVLAPLAKRLWARALGDQLEPALDAQVFTDFAEVDHFADSFLRSAARGGEETTKGSRLPVPAPGTAPVLG